MLDLGHASSLSLSLSLSFFSYKRHAVNKVILSIINCSVRLNVTGYDTVASHLGRHDKNVFFGTHSSGCMLSSNRGKASSRHHADIWFSKQKIKGGASEC